MIERLAGQHVVLLGIGHTNAHVLRMWGMHAIEGADLTCISDYSVATYSGMLPAVLAGLSTEEEMQIDLVRLCGSVGARLITAQAVSIDHAAREIHFDSRPPVPFDALSIGIGSVPSTDSLTGGADRVIKIKPMQTFLQRLRDAIDHAAAANGAGELRVMVVGGGVAGTEITLCLPPFLNRSGGANHTLHLLTRSDQILPEALDRAREKVLAKLGRRGVTVTTGRSVTKVEPDHVTLDDGTRVPTDIVIWATGAVAPRLLSEFDLPVTDRGFIATDSTLRTIAGYPVFAVGDTGTIQEESLPKAGVYAVRQGPVLWENLQRLLKGQTLRTYQPQRSFLKLINQGDGTAIGQWHALSFSGKWAMRWKDHIDTRFMEKYQPSPMRGDDDDPMQCRGCGCKLDGDLLALALDHDRAESKLEDAAAIGGQAEAGLLASTDFFTSPFEDGYLAGRVAALHAASDIVASGARATEALANVVLPDGDGRSQQRLLRDFLAGASFEFEAMGAKIVGGHTIVGPRMEIGFTVIGQSIGKAPIVKDQLKPGNQLLLTKPLGIGILLAAHARSFCAAADFESLLETMLCRQHVIAEIAVACGIRAGTDVTGFGLAGHLLEMLDASGVGGCVDLATLPALPGVQRAIADGIESSLAPANRRVQRKLRTRPTTQSYKRELLFDPQTCGGLLLGTDPASVESLRQRFADAGLEPFTVIGEVVERRASEPPLEIR